MQRTVLAYDNGSILIRGGISHIPYASFDPRKNSLRAQALYYQNILDYLKQSEVEYDDSRVLDLIPSPNITLDQSDSTGHNVSSDNNINNDRDNTLSLRDYQQKALDSWIKAGKRGCIVLPTGAGKTVIGVKAIEVINSASLVVVPTIDLMDQWTSVLSKYFKNIKIGNLGGGLDDIQAITVCTYDSAYIRAPNIGNKFALVIFDEVHHLAATGYRSIAEQLASFEIERRHVEMLPEEVEEYKRNFGIYQTNLIKMGLKMNYSDSFRKLIMMSGKSSIARQAVLARNKAMDVALNSKSKIEELREILSENKGRKTIIFTQHNKLVYNISDQFLIPFITYKSTKAERQDTLQGFKDGRYIALVTSKVLDEGVDVPDAEIGIILSGTGSSREFIQRLGRLLRPKPFTKDKAKLIEIVSSGTGEMGTSAKRKRAFKKIDI